MDIPKEISVLHRKAFIYIREDKRLQAAETLEELCVELEAQFGDSDMYESTRSILGEALKHYRDSAIDIRSSIVIRQIIKGQTAPDIELAKRYGYAFQIGPFIEPTFKGWNTASRHITEFEINESYLRNIVDNEEREIKTIAEENERSEKLEQARKEREVERRKMEEEMEKNRIAYQQRKEEILKRGVTFDSLFPNSLPRTNGMKAKLIGKKLRDTRVEMAIILVKHSNGDTKEEMIRNLDKQYTERYNALKSHEEDLLCAAYNLGPYNTMKALERAENLSFKEKVHDGLGNHMEIDDLL